MILPLILSGGSGTRLWPLSRSNHPKQVLPLLGEASMLQDTLDRFESLSHVNSAVVICNEAYRFLVSEEVEKSVIDEVDIILEPVGRGTAPAIALGALHGLSSGDDPIILVLPSDHKISDVDRFLNEVERAEAICEEGYLVTFGILPRTPEPGFGYIKAGGDEIKPGIFRVEAFVEKPNIESAKSYVADGGYFWNSGIFMFKASTYLEALSKHAPDILHACEKAYSGAETDLGFVRVDETEFASSPMDTIDYAIMEKADHVAVVPVDIGWNDVGSWAALHEVSARDENGNTGKGDVRFLDSKNCYARSDGKLTVVLGVDDLVIVDTDDALLVSHKDKVQDIKSVVDNLAKEHRPEVSLHKKVLRPWGSYQGIDQEERFQVKRITVKPGEKLSLQMHHHRAEHWIVVQGTASVTRGEDEFLVSENESTYIPLGVTHRLENVGKIPLHLIEVQTGSYLGEDDIVRFEDIMAEVKADFIEISYGYTSRPFDMLTLK